MASIEDFLASNQITFIRHEHPAVFTCEEAEKYCSDIPGLSCKNLLLRDKKGKRFFLLVLPASKRTDLKKFGTIVEEGKVTFANSEILKAKLDVEPGSVSPFGLIHDVNNEVEVYIDKEVHDARIVGFHPNSNTSTLEITQEMFKKFLEVIGKSFRVVEL